MLIETEARIYLESHRGCTQYDGFCSFHTFNFGTYREAGREPFGTLKAFDDQTLLPQTGTDVNVEELTEIIIIPVVGGTEFFDQSQEARYINSGEVYRFFAEPGNNYQIINPYSKETINYLMIRFRSAGLQSKDTCSNQAVHSCFNLSHKNKLHAAFSTFTGMNRAVLGQYTGREGDIYKVQNPGNGTFAFVIEGAFEINNRLLERRDGLALPHVKEVEFEALSNDAIILLVEVGI